MAANQSGAKVVVELLRPELDKNATLTNSAIQELRTELLLRLNAIEALLTQAKEASAPKRAIRKTEATPSPPAAAASDGEVVPEVKKDKSQTPLAFFKESVVQDKYDFRTKFCTDANCNKPKVLEDMKKFSESKSTDKSDSGTWNKRAACIYSVLSSKDKEEIKACQSQNSSSEGGADQLDVEKD